MLTLDEMSEFLIMAFCECEEAIDSFDPCLLFTHRAANIAATPFTNMVQMKLSIAKIITMIIIFGMYLLLHA